MAEKINNCTSLQCDEDLTDLLNAKTIFQSKSSSFFDIKSSNLNTLQQRLNKRIKNDQLQSIHLHFLNNKQCILRANLIDMIYKYSTKLNFYRETTALAIQYCDYYLYNLYKNEQLLDDNTFDSPNKRYKRSQINKNDNNIESKQEVNKDKHIKIQPEEKQQQDILHKYANTNIYVKKYIDLLSNNLSLLAGTSLLIAAKYEQTTEPYALKSLGKILKPQCTNDELITMEIQFLEVLDWNIVLNTINSWILFYIKFITIYNTIHNQDNLSKELISDITYFKMLLLIDTISYHSYFSSIKTYKLSIAILITICPELISYIPILSNNTYTINDMNQLIHMLTTINNQLTDTIDYHDFETSYYQQVYHHQLYTFYISKLSNIQIQETLTSFKKIADFPSTTTAI